MHTAVRFKVRINTPCALLQGLTCSSTHNMYTVARFNMKINTPCTLLQGLKYRKELTVLRTTEISTRRSRSDHGRRGRDTNPRLGHQCGASLPAPLPPALFSLSIKALSLPKLLRWFWWKRSPSVLLGCCPLNKANVLPTSLLSPSGLEWVQWYRWKWNYLLEWRTAHLLPRSSSASFMGTLPEDTF